MGCLCAGRDSGHGGGPAGFADMVGSAGAERARDHDRAVDLTEFFLEGRDWSGDELSATRVDLIAAGPLTRRRRLADHVQLSVGTRFSLPELWGWVFVIACTGRSMNGVITLPSAGIPA